MWYLPFPSCFSDDYKFQKNTFLVLWSHYIYRVSRSVCCWESCSVSFLSHNVLWDLTILCPYFSRTSCGSLEKCATIWSFTLAFNSSQVKLEKCSACFRFHSVSAHKLLMCVEYSQQWKRKAEKVDTGKSKERIRVRTIKHKGENTLAIK